MKQYKVIRDNHGFKGRMWHEGMIVDLEDDANPPKWFELIGESSDPTPEPEKPKDQIALSQMHQPKKATSGFAYQANEAAPKRVVTAAEKLANDKGKR